MGGRVTLSNVRQWADDLRRAIAQRAATEAKLHDTYYNAVTTENRQHAEALEALTAAYEVETAELTARLTETHDALVESWDNDLASFDASTAEQQRSLARTYEAERSSAEKKRQDTEWMVGSILDDQADDSPQQHLIRLQSQTTSAAAEMQQAVSKAERQRVEALAHLARCRMSLEPSPIEPPEPVESLKLLQDRCLGAAQEADVPYQRLMRQWLPYLFRGVTPVIVAIVVAVGLAAGVWVGVTPE